MKLVLSVVFLLSVSVSAQLDYEVEGEEILAEREYEKQVNKIFAEYNKNFIATTKWNSLVKELGEEKYTIRKKDTLWDISETLFGDGFYWPKVWSFNPKIENPHEISEGDTIRFDYGDYENPPKIELVRGADVKIPEPTVQFTPLVKILPRSIPVDKLDIGNQSVGEQGFVAKMKLYGSLAPVIQLNAFYAEDYPNTVGEVTELLPHRRRAGIGDTIYVEMTEGNPGSIFTVIAENVLELDGYDEARGRSADGLVVKVLAEIRLEQVVNKDDGLYRATVLKSLDPIQLDSQVIRGPLPEVKMGKEGRSVRIQATVVGGGGRRNRTVMGTGETIFLSVGSTDGVKEGDVVTLIANDDLRKDGDTDIEVGHRVLGRARIVKTDQTVSTAIVTDSVQEISSGDLTL